MPAFLASIDPLGSGAGAAPCALWLACTAPVLLGTGMRLGTTVGRLAVRAVRRLAGRAARRLLAGRLAVAATAGLAAIRRTRHVESDRAARLEAAHHLHLDLGLEHLLVVAQQRTLFR